MISLAVPGDFCVYMQCFFLHLEDWALSAAQFDGLDLNNTDNRHF